MKRIRTLFFLILYLPVILYRYITRKAFYITGTFLDTDGTRMFFKTTFLTYGNILPIQSLERKTALQFDVPSVVILHFNRIPWGMVKYVEKEMEMEIEINKL